MASLPVSVGSFLLLSSIPLTLIHHPLLSVHPRKAIHIHEVLAIKLQSHSIRSYAGFWVNVSSLFLGELPKSRIPRSSDNVCLS